MQQRPPSWYAVLDRYRSTAIPSIAETIRQRAALLGGAGGEASPRLERLTGFGSNPGALDGWFYAPDAAPATVSGMPLVVVLHGCTQRAADYDRHAGWSDLADRFGFAVLFPEQRRANNANLCFNWFVPEHIARDRGEALSIRQMIDAVSAAHAIDPQRRYVTGLSAGGAMAAVMLAAYPELFAGGGIIAGLPYGGASSTMQALERMRGAGHPGTAAYADAVRRASPHAGPWPTISIWHGDADRTVDVANAEALIGQWAAVHGIAGAPDLVDTVDGQRRRVWQGEDGRMRLEDYRITGFGHGAPLKTAGEASCGSAGAFMLEAGISSTWRQAERWGLLAHPRTAAAGRRSAAAAREGATPAGALPGVTATIERALRAAGLMR